MPDLGPARAVDQVQVTITPMAYNLHLIGGLSRGSY